MFVCSCRFASGSIGLDFSYSDPTVLVCIRLLGLTDSLYDEIKSLPLEEDFGEETTGFNSGSRKLKKRKVCVFKYMGMYFCYMFDFVS